MAAERRRVGGGDGLVAVKISDLSFIDAVWGAGTPGHFYKLQD